MKKLKIISLAIFLIGIFSSIFTQNTVCFTIETNTNTGQAFTGFTKYVNVLDCFDIYAESTIPDAKVLHAAAVAAELLDNNEDGTVDDPLLKAELQSKQALMPIFSQDGSSAENNFFNYYNGNGAAAVLYQNEMSPSQTGHWGSDASVEEIIHVINDVGHTNVYPSAFALTPNSSLMSAAMDVARGGQFTSIPATYPTAAWYHYDDATCDYQCMAIEYMYWSIVSHMGILDDPTTCSGIANEWEPCSPTLFQSTDVLMYDLITDTQYKLPQLAPDGNYCPAGMSIKDHNNKVTVFPNPTKGIIQLSSHQNPINHIEIYNNIGQKIFFKNSLPNEEEINLTKFPLGIYYISINHAEKQKIILVE